ncbi:hypothetical protein DPMN_026090 [Dreissena polymorpha]|uniref:Uncharacterized protein n=1 Tax=Dreissena polymorpha TaxID=45954 RepID=A0A9D4LSS6_DREPO|nr:hypothetical protein DPMN_026090 [Dreissena polymorpha]
MTCNWFCQVPVAQWMWCPPSNREVMGLIPTVGVLFRSPPYTPSTGSSPRKWMQECLNKP